MTILDCASCGVIYGITAEFEQRRRDDGVSFYCPNGHRQGYGKSAADLEREKAATLERRLKWAEGRETHLKDQLQATEYQRRAAKGQLTKAKKRIAAGLCPCCKRNFQNLANHMAGQHPDYGQAEASA
jgi:hypothetical protein